MLLCFDRKKKSRVLCKFMLRKNNNIMSVKIVCTKTHFIIKFEQKFFFFVWSNRDRYMGNCTLYTKIGRKLGVKIKWKKRWVGGLGL